MGRKLGGTDAKVSQGTMSECDEIKEASGEARTPYEDWEPDEEFLRTIKDKITLQAILCLVQFLAPKVGALCEKNDVTDQSEVLQYIQNTTLVGILPVPHPIVIRTYQASVYTSMWFTTYMWGVIFTRTQRMPLYDWKKIKLVVINQ